MSELYDTPWARLMAYCNGPTTQSEFTPEIKEYIFDGCNYVPYYDANPVPSAICEVQLKRETVKPFAIKKYVREKNPLYKKTCDFCQKVFREKNFLRQHIYRHLGIHRTCAKILTGLKHPIHGYRGTPAGVYAIQEYCSPTRPTKPLSPIKEYIYNGNYYECNWCNMFKSHNLSSIRLHKVRDHKGLAENPVTSDKRPYACNLCDFVTYTSGSYRIHLEFDHGKPKYECPHCKKKTFEKQADFSKHMDTKHSGQCPCEICGVLLPSMSAVVQHKKWRHFNEKTAHTCDICKKVVSRKGTLYLHILKHLGISKEKALDPCPTCGKLIQRGTGMKLHMDVHANVKNFSCEVCGKGFVRKEVLTVHMRTHTGEKPFKCTVCGKSFSQRTPLTNHMKKIHS